MDNDGRTDVIGVVGGFCRTVPVEGARPSANVRLRLELR